MLVTAPGIESVDLSHWKVVIGGAMLPEDLCKQALDRGIDIYSAYGMSETCPLLTAALLKPTLLSIPKDQQVAFRCKTGLPAVLVDVQVVDAHDNPVEQGMTGEVVVRSPWLTKGYYKDEDKTKELWKNGWLHTGDVGFIDEYNYLKITDRIKDVIKTGGEWVSSLDLENIMSQHPAVFECAAVGVPDPKWGERPLLVIKLKDDCKNTVDDKQLHAFMLQAAKDGKIPKYGVPDKFEFVDTIPKTSVGKIDKKEIRKKYSQPVVATI